MWVVVRTEGRGRGGARARDCYKRPGRFRDSNARKSRYFECPPKNHPPPKKNLEGGGIIIEKSTLCVYNTCESLWNMRENGHPPYLRHTR